VVAVLALVLLGKFVVGNVVVVWQNSPRPPKYALRTRSDSVEIGFTVLPHEDKVTTT
jgi:hypothetical protein